MIFSCLGWFLLRYLFQKVVSLSESGEMTGFVFGLYTSWLTSCELLGYATQVDVATVATAYYLMDIFWLFQYPAMMNQTLMLLCHHILSLIALTLLHWYPEGRGMFYVFFLLAEITNPIQQSFALWKRHYNASITWQYQVFVMLSTWYTFLYITIRVVSWPALLYLWTSTGKFAQFPPEIGRVAQTVLGLLICGSYIWSYRLARGWLKLINISLGVPRM